MLSEIRKSTGPIPPTRNNEKKTRRPRPIAPSRSENKGASGWPGTSDRTSTLALGTTLPASSVARK
jgi:hypothetical protein